MDFYDTCGNPRTDLNENREIREIFFELNNAHFYSIEAIV